MFTSALCATALCHSTQSSSTASCFLLKWSVCKFASVLNNFNTRNAWLTKNIASPGSWWIFFSNRSLLYYPFSALRAYLPRNFTVRYFQSPKKLFQMVATIDIKGMLSCVKFEKTCDLDLGPVTCVLYLPLKSSFRYTRFWYTLWLVNFDNYCQHLSILDVMRNAVWQRREIFHQVTHAKSPPWGRVLPKKLARGVPLAIKTLITLYQTTKR